jgi:hypothetical protein
MRPRIPKPVRQLVWDRAGGLCEKCGLGLIQSANFSYSNHHRLLKSRGGQDTVDNLALLCGSGTTGCHGLVHNPLRGNETAPVDEGWIVESGTNPQVVPVRHWSGRRLHLLPDGNYGEQVWVA